MTHAAAMSSCQGHSSLVVAGQAFLSTLIGARDFGRWEHIRTQQGIPDDTGFIKWLLDVAEFKSSLNKYETQSFDGPQHFIGNRVSNPSHVSPENVSSLNLANVPSSAAELRVRNRNARTRPIHKFQHQHMPQVDHSRQTLEHAFPSPAAQLDRTSFHQVLGVTSSNLSTLSENPGQVVFPRSSTEKEYQEPLSMKHQSSPLRQNLADVPNVPVKQEILCGSDEEILNEVPARFQSQEEITLDDSPMVPNAIENNTSEEFSKIDKSKEESRKRKIGITEPDTAHATNMENAVAPISDVVNDMGEIDSLYGPRPKSPELNAVEHSKKHILATEELNSEEAAEKAKCDRLMAQEICFAELEQNAVMDGLHFPDNFSDFEKSQDVQSLHQCHICDAKFKRNWNLVRHVKVIHAKIKEFRCEGCGREFSFRQTLQTHTGTSLLDGPFQCTSCQLVFPLKCAWRHHVASGGCGVRNSIEGVQAQEPAQPDHQPDNSALNSRLQ